MKVTTKVKVDMAPVQQIMKRLGIDAQGDVQRFHTANVRRRIQKYMPYRSGTTIKLMIIQSPVNQPRLNINVPYARMLYYGKVMVDPETGIAGFLTPNGWRSRKGVPKVVSGRDIQYDKSKHPQAGPFWDRRLMAAEGAAMAADIQEYINKRKRK